MEGRVGRSMNVIMAGTESQPGSPSDAARGRVVCGWN
jgi:hypothetical protein